MIEKSYGQELYEKLSYTSKNAWEVLKEEEKPFVFDLAEKYKHFLNCAKTEREVVEYFIERAKEKGYKEFNNNIQELKPGDKVYFINNNKSILLAHIGKKPLKEGFNLIGSHIDSPRLDLKPKPLYESSELALLKTHYYGGIKKYHWVNVPLSIHGVVVKSDGSKVKITIGEDENDPVFYITDLLVHLSSDQLQKKASEAIPAENLNVLIGSMPFNDEKVKEKVKLNVLKILNEKYGITEEDLISADIEVVPAAKARDVGLDRSLIGAYGQDDRACSFLAAEGIFSIDETPEKTALVYLVDKEEIGSVGISSAEASFFDVSVAKLMKALGEYENSLDLALCFENSAAISGDVAAALDPTYEGAYDKLNSTLIGHGVTIEKYTGVRGKYSGSEATAEYVGKIRNFLNSNNICWQTGLLGKVDQGGGGTIAMFIARKMINVIDSGVPVLSMHSTFEITSKVDVYMTYKFYNQFLRKFE
ncbi:aminopeptidase [Caldicellulosiruptor sp. DIB 104C]|uniref:aminopeptidase n=1 Tax=Caldicellulosiruptor sp. DIB 104C TaxID=3019889 RepID=UPI0023054116|nr:aminopeptidase [Caldicellulosiruptor sp. DIB 104C]